MEAGWPSPKLKLTTPVVNSTHRTWWAVCATGTIDTLSRRPNYRRPQRPKLQQRLLATLNLNSLPRAIGWPSMHNAIRLLCSKRGGDKYGLVFDRSIATQSWLIDQSILIQNSGDRFLVQALCQLFWVGPWISRLIDRAVDRSINQPKGVCLS